VAGACLRLFFLIFTPGTYDLEIWHEHAAQIAQDGLIRYYHENPEANHPPFMFEAGVALLQGSQVTGIPFDILFRLPFALLDAGTAMLLWALLGDLKRRPWLVAGYWLNPLAILISSYHGNTDSAVAFFTLLSVWFLSKDRLFAGALAAGAGLWIKLPGIWAVPALLLLCRGWRARLAFLALAGITAVSTYLPAFFLDAPVVWKNVFGYHGLTLVTSAGIPIWGLVRGILDPILPAAWAQPPDGPLLWLLLNGWKIAAALMLLLVWLRRKQSTAPEVCATIAITYALLCGWSENWAFQYFAWTLPFWFFLPAWFPILATALAGGYVYSLYWFLCGNPLLLGTWDFIGKPRWPFIVVLFRNLAVLFFWGSGNGFVIAALKSFFTQRHAPAPAPATAGSVNPPPAPPGCP
jgi:hypothetical protein